MNRVHRLGLGALALALCVSPMSAAIAAEPPAATAGDRAAELYRRATEQYRATNLVEAEKLYSEAWTLQQSYDIATNLGAVELDLKKFRAAAEHLAFALRAFPARGKQDERDTIAQRLTLAKAEIATLRVRVNVDKADVSVNGKRAGVSPLTEEIFADPGTVTIEAGLDGYAPAKQQLVTKKGEAREVVLEMVRQEAPQGRSMLGPAIAFGVGGAGLVVGVVAAAVAAGKTADLKQICGDPIRCPAAERGNLDAATTTAHVSTAGFVLAGLGAAAGVVLLLVPTGPKPKAQTAIVAGPSFLGVKGTF